MQVINEKLAVRLGEGFLASGISLDERRLNAFHRDVYLHRGADLAFINGMIATGIRGSASLTGDELTANTTSLRSAARRLLPLVLHTGAWPSGEQRPGHLNAFEHIYQLAGSGCFVLVAGSAEEEMDLTLIAHRIAELALVPGIVVRDYDAPQETAAIPGDELIRQYLGDPDDQIPSPTPAQEMIFGKTRRRVPNWFNMDTPVMSGVSKDATGISFEGAARKMYILEHLGGLIDQAFGEFEALTGKAIPQVHLTGKKQSSAMVTASPAVAGLLNAQELQEQRTDMIRLVRLFPFPEKELSQAIQGRKGITVLEPVFNELADSTGIFDRMKMLDTSGRIHLYRAWYRTGISRQELGLAIDRMTSGKAPFEYYLGIPFSRETGRYPKHDLLLKDIDQRYPGAADKALVVPQGTSARTNSGAQTALPLALRAYQDHGANYTRLTRFYADTAFFYATGNESETLADPFQAVPAVPPATAAFFSEAANRQTIPAFSSEKCTACGDCFIYCPHAAVRPLAISASKLVQAGITLAGQKGRVLTKLTPMVRHFDLMTGAVAEEFMFERAGEVLPEIFERVAKQMNLEGEALATARNEFAEVVAEIGAMPVAVTDALFSKPDSIEKGKGEFFTLAIDPSGCTACGLCANVCPAEAIEMVAQDEQHLAEANIVFDLWERLPDTSGETVNRLYKDPDYPSFAALMLSRNYAMTMTGGDRDDAGGPQKTMLHWMSSTTEAVIQPRYLSMLGKLDQLIEGITGNIHKKLSKALPRENLEQLSRTLDEAKGKRLSLKEIIGQYDETSPGSLIDSNDMRRKTHLLDELKTLKWVMHEGPGGVGRSRYGMLLAAGASMPWARAFPGNHFTSPCLVHWSGSAPEEALGLFFGNLRFVLDQIKLIRRAELEIKDNYDPNVHDHMIAGLQWDDLSTDEKSLVPPILLVADRKDLDDAGWNQLNRILADRYPVKVCLFDSVAPAGNEEVASMAIADSGLIGAIALKNAFVLRGGPGNLQHLYEGLMDGLATSGPALFMIYATDPYRHTAGMDNWSHYAALAGKSRAWPAVRFAPKEDRDHLAGSLSLEGNDAFLEDWVKEELSIDGEQTMEYTITWADWAYTQTDWKREFLFVEDSSTNMPVAAYLQLSKKDRAGRIPVIMRSDGKGIRYFSAGQRVIAMCEYVLSSWRTLQDLAGLRSEFPQELRKRVAGEFEDALVSEKARLEKEYAEKLRDMEAAQTEIWKNKLKERLVALSAMANKQSNN